MKKLLLLTFTLYHSIAASAQWTIVDSPSTNIIRAIHFLNSDTGFVTDGSGNIYKTIDGGSNWTNPSSGVSVQLRGIDFINDSVGFICGQNVLLKSIDAGETWIADTTWNSTLRAIDFLNDSLGFLAGAAGNIFRTTDGGQTWTAYSTGLITDVIQLQMANAQVGYAVTSTAVFPFDSGYVLKTINGGDTWEPVYFGSGSGYLGLAVANASTVFIGGNDETILKSEDGGQSWDTVHTGIAYYTVRSGFAISTGDIFMVDDGGGVLHTFDGGTTWADTFLVTGLYSIFFANPHTGFIGDGFGDVYKLMCQQLGSIGSIDGADMICENDTVAFSIDPVSGASGYSWSVSSGATIVEGNGTDTITIVSDSGAIVISVTAFGECDTASTSFDVQIIASPPLPIITFDSDTLTSTPALSYQWYFNGSIILGATDQTYSPTVNGFYSVIITNAFGCQSASLPFDVFGLVASELIAKSGFEIYPNPLSTSSAIFIHECCSEQHLLISDVTGKKLRDLEISKQQNVILQRADFVEGIYFVSLVNGENELMAVQKLVVQ